MESTISNSKPFASLERLFHEPARLAIMSALCADAEGCSFGELKQECGLTDGNLSRHLRTLEDANVVRIHKAFLGAKPHTTVSFTDTGRESFINYLNALEEVLKRASDVLASAPVNKAMSAPLSVALTPTSAG